jgi:SAM-dependent methyltransferase
MNGPARQPHAVQDLPSRDWKGEKILRVLGLAPRETPWRVLEIGTGSGGIARYIGTHPRLHCEVTSVDVVDIRKVHEGFDFRIVEDTTLPFAGDAFDVVISNHVIEHVGDADAQRAHLRECARVLAPDGRGYLAVPNRWMLVEPHFRLAFLSWLPRTWRDPYVRLAGKGEHFDCEPLTVPELERLFESAGLAYGSASVRAMRETFAIEGTRGVIRSMVARVPDAFWHRVADWIPTLIYRFGARASSDAPVPHQ